MRAIAASILAALAIIIGVGSILQAQKEIAYKQDVEMRLSSLERTTFGPYPHLSED